MRGVWISGWGVAPERLRPLAEKLAPRAGHVFLPPTGRAPDQAAACDFVVGWSLGAFRILQAASAGARLPRALLLAPFAGFCSEHGLGGRTAVAQVRWLLRWVKRDAPGALADFYSRAGLGRPPATLPCELAELLEGLETLAGDLPAGLREFAACGVPESWVAVVGDRDPLLEAGGVCRSIRGCRVVAGAGHAPEDFFSQVEEFFRAL